MRTHPHLFHTAAIDGVTDAHTGKPAPALHAGEMASEMDQSESSLHPTVWQI